MIPDSCPSKATAGERRVYALLRDAFLAWYEPVVAGRYHDFTVLAADTGLLMLEVKGWYAGQIARATDREVELHRAAGDRVKVEIHQHPRLQMSRTFGPCRPRPAGSLREPRSPARQGCIASMGWDGRYLERRCRG